MNKYFVHNASRQHIIGLQSVRLCYACVV